MTANQSMILAFLIVGAIGLIILVIVVVAVGVGHR